jgi:predicted transcriptional regulator
MDTMVLERPKVARKSAGYVLRPTVLPRPAAEDMRGIPWYMTMEEVHAELDQAIEDVECGRYITHEELLKKHPEWS